MNTLTFFICLFNFVSFSITSIDKEKIKLITEYHYSIDVPETLNKSFSYRYDINGNVLQEEEKDGSDELIKRTVYLYDTRKRLIEKKSFFHNGETLRSVFLYTGNKNECRNYSGKNELISKTISFLNDSGRVTRYETYNSEGKIFNIHTFRYTEKNQEKEEVISYPDGTTEWKSESIYNEKGKLIRRNEYPSCCLSIVYSYRYDDRGNLSGENSIRADGSRGIEYSYQYLDPDKNGNWLVKIISENNKPTTVIKRSIEYFTP